jgi:oligopeptide/dipeptide ABC transporter ATP-binding protein
MTAHIAPMPAEHVSAFPEPRTVLDVQNLSLSFRNAEGLLPIVTDVSFSIAAGEAVALVGESGCGKSITASAVMGIAPENAEIGGTITLNGNVISGLPPKERRKLCGRHMGFIFQEPMTALHPTLSIGRQMTDTLKHNLGLGSSAATDRAAELLDRVGIPGTVPPVGQWPEGCRFAPRCSRADEQCRTRPQLSHVGKTDVRCWHPLEASA